MKASKILSYVSLLLLAVQAALPKLHIANAQHAVLFSATVIYANIFVGALKTYVSDDTSNRALLYSLAITIAATAGALNEYLNVLPLSEDVAQWARFGITIYTTAFSFNASKMYPNGTTPQ